MPRKPLDIDPEEVLKLARIGCNNVEIAGFFGVTEGLIRKRYSEYVTKGQSEQLVHLRRRQYESADGGNVTMLIWLGKQVLGQSDKIESRHEITKGYDVGNSPEAL